MQLQSSFLHAAGCRVSKVTLSRSALHRSQTLSERQSTGIRCSRETELLKEPLSQVLVRPLHKRQSLVTCYTGKHSQEGLPRLQVSKNFSPFDRVSVLSEALPYLQQFRNKTIVIKYGGAAMKDPLLKVSTTLHFKKSFPPLFQYTLSREPLYASCL